jgi:hypothetical protein
MARTSSAQFDRTKSSLGDVVGHSAGELPVVHVVNPEAVATLAAVAAMEGDELRELAEAWSATEEFSGWTDAEATELLRAIGDLAESASLENKCLFLWQGPSTERVRPERGRSRQLVAR